MKRILIQTLVGLSIFISYMIFGAIFNGNHKWMILFTSISSFSISYWIFHRKNDINKVMQYLILVLPIVLLFIIMSLFLGFSYSTIYIFLIPLSCLLGAKFAITGKKVLPFVAVLIFPMMAFIIFPNMFVFMNNYNARTNKKYSEVTLLNKDKDTIVLDSVKIIALDFWTTSCGICFQTFPDLERQYLELKGDKRIQIYSVNVPVRNDSLAKTIKLVEELAYDFPTLYATSIEEIEKLGIDAYPHLLILKNGRIRYDGRLYVVKLYVVKLK